MTFPIIAHESSHQSAEIASQLNKMLAMKLTWLFQKECEIADMIQNPKTPQFR